MSRKTAAPIGAAFAVAVLMTLTAGAANALHLPAWDAPQKIDEIEGNSSELNTIHLDGCPILSPDGLSLYMATNRPRHEGDPRTDINIWVAHRESRDGAWGDPQILPEPINSEVDDFCPTPVHGKGLFFVSRRAVLGACGGSDIFFTRLNPARGWNPPIHFACAADGGPNSPLDEQGPSYFKTATGAFLYFSSGPDIYVSNELADGSFGPATPVAELNGPAADIQPNVRKDGLEIVFASNDPNRTGAQGGQDIYGATRESVDDPWSVPENAGTLVNTGANETRPSFSWDARTLLFGRAPGPEGSTDIYIATRDSIPR
jgi:hypothetical protein